jgi:[protein-PII] uridylyltransferase
MKQNNKINPETLRKFPLPFLAREGVREAGNIKAFLTKIQSSTQEMHASDIAVRDILAWRTAAIDRLLIVLFDESLKGLSPNDRLKETYTMIAQGGYGRRELAFHSDIDLLFLYHKIPESVLKERVEKVLYPLWDSDLQIGFAVRTAKECLQVAKSDLTIFTSLLDIRYLAGNTEQFDKFQLMFIKKLKKRSVANWFVQMKSQEQDQRARKFGDSVYLLEPNIKEGRGGLRDFHHIHWFALVFFQSTNLAVFVNNGWINEQELSSLEQATSFLWKLRDQLHHLSQRKNDQILLQYLEPVTKSLGFRDGESILAVEDMMRTYYQHATTCLRINQRITRKAAELKNRRFFSNRSYRSKAIDKNYSLIRNRLAINDRNLFEKDIYHLLYIFRLLQIHGYEIEERVKEGIQKNAYRIDAKFLSMPRVGKLFRKMLSEPQTIVSALMSMHETGILDSFLPEFHNLIHRAQHDIYHVYTVDIHSILAVGELGKLLDGHYKAAFPTPTRIAHEIKKKDLLAFSILYHDIGKGEGSGHVAKGAPLIRAASERLGFSSNDIDLSEVLELSHLIMPHLAFRRDLDDPQLILNFAQAINSEETLKMLYVLTFCDIKAVSAEALTGWKETLLEQLFLKTQSVLKDGNFDTTKISAMTRKLRSEVMLIKGAGIAASEVDTFFNNMPPRYFLNTEAVTVLDHMNMRHKYETHPFVFRERNLDKEGVSELTLYTLDVPQLFSNICGVLAAHNTNISEAQLHLTKEGHALNIIKLKSAQGTMIKSSQRWKRIETDLRRVVEQTADVAKLVLANKRPTFYRPKQARKLPTKVLIDNDLSAFYTVIDIYAHDRVGLLYEITSILEFLGLYIEISKIATKVDQVTDTFYVKDIFGHKIIDKRRLQVIQKKLLDCIAEKASTDPLRSETRVS